MASVVGTAIFDLIQEPIVVIHHSRHILVLPCFVEQDAVPKLVKPQVMTASESKQVVAGHQERTAKPARLQNGLPHDDSRMADPGLANGMEHLLYKCRIHWAACVEFI